MNALGRLHRALVPGGTLYDLQPRGGSARVVTGLGEVGSLDEREFFRDARATERLVDRVVREGLFGFEAELAFLVRSSFDSAEELVETVSGFRRVRVSKRLVARVRRSPPPFRLVEPASLRRYRALTTG